MPVQGASITIHTEADERPRCALHGTVKGLAPFAALRLDNYNNAVVLSESPEYLLRLCSAALEAVAGLSEGRALTDDETVALTEVHGWLVRLQGDARDEAPGEVEDVPSGPRYPNVEVVLSGQDGNGFFIASRVRTALKQAGVPEEQCEAFFADALSGDYDHLLQTAMAWVNVQ